MRGPNNEIEITLTGRGECIMSALIDLNKQTTDAIEAVHEAKNDDEPDNRER